MCSRTVGRVEITSGGTDGPELAREWADLDTNVWGGIHDAQPHRVAEQLVNAGWRARASGWNCYEVEQEWVWIELEGPAIAFGKPVDDQLADGYVLFSGVVDPSRYDDLAAVFEQLGVRYEMEQWDAEQTEIIRKWRRPPTADGSGWRNSGLPVPADVTRSVEISPADRRLPG
jgi:hypothetical protein